jgi:hypothetical protein
VIVSLFIAVPPVPKLESLSPAFMDFSFQAGEVSRPASHSVRVENPFRLPFTLGVVPIPVATG